MKSKTLILFFGLCVMAFLGCEDLLEPANKNFPGKEQIYSEPNFGKSFLMYAYNNIPGYYDNSEYATDDAVTNNRNNDFLRAATGNLTAESNPFSRWESYASILHLNMFIEEVDNMRFIGANDTVNWLTQMRTKGEAHGLRALHLYYILRAHAGYTADGKLMGVPVINRFQDVQADFNQPRATFEACIQQIYADLDKAEEYLPWEYGNISNSNEIPDRFLAITPQRIRYSSAVYNRAMGTVAFQLFNGLISSAVRSRVSLLAASPAFQDPSNTVTWEMAANHAAKVINSAGGISGLAANGHTFYTNAAEITALAEGRNPPEMIWRASKTTTNTDLERDHFPPSLFGNGRMNPTQNLVDAFPMANGYPISDNASGYNPDDPYTARDPRLGLYIIYNGSRAGVNNTQIWTGTESTTDDGINIRETSTRTGYYMKKRLRMDVNRNPSSTTHQQRYIPRIRYTEIFLNYAEAANEAWGPTGTGNNSYSAYDVIKAIRTRAGVGIDNDDPYLEGCKADKDKMRELIRNERRLELCFESFRFWDLRRWKSDLTEPARGMNVNGDIYAPMPGVELRSYRDYMHYGPIPYSEVLKYSNLLQNRGW